MILGSGKYTYEVVEDWAKLPPNWSFVDVAGIAIDSKGQVYVFNRGSHPMMIFNREGSFLKSWGDGMFREPHNVRIGPDDLVYCADYGDHTVRKVTSDGEVTHITGAPPDCHTLQKFVRKHPFAE